MPTFTVHAPPPRKGDTASAAERFMFVRDGFYVWAFVLAPFWLLRYRLWLAFAIYVVVSIALAVVLRLTGAGATVQFLTGLDRKSTRLNSSHKSQSRMPSSA